MSEVPEVPVHAHAGCRVETASGFAVPHSPERRTKGRLREHRETKTLVVGPVPRHLGEGGQAQAGQTFLPGPVPNPAEERSTDPLPLPVGKDTYLLDVRSAIQDVDKDEAHCHVAIRRQPASARGGIAVERFFRRDLKVGHGLQPDLAEPPPAKRSISRSRAESAGRAARILIFMFTNAHPRRGTQEQLALPASRGG